MNILNEKPQIGGARINDLSGKISRGVGSAATAVFKKAEYGVDAGTFLTERATQGAIDARSGVKRFVSEVTPEQTGVLLKKIPNLNLRDNLPHIPVSNMIKAGSKYNTFYKLIILVVFFTIFLKVIINIFRFFGIDIIDIYSYMGWIIFLLIILFFIPHDYSTLKLN
jgi:hypothetical protein